jgi:hypothetical protein
MVGQKEVFHRVGRGNNAIPERWEGELRKGAEEAILKEFKEASKPRAPKESGDAKIDWENILNRRLTKLREGLYSLDGNLPSPHPLRISDNPQEGVTQMFGSAHEAIDFLEQNNISPVLVICPTVGVCAGGILKPNPIFRHFPTALGNREEFQLIWEWNNEVHGLSDKGQLCDLSKFKQILEFQFKEWWKSVVEEFEKK